MSNPTVQIAQLDHIAWLDGEKCDYTVSQSNQVWRININTNISQLNTLAPLLNADENQRTSRYHQEKDKHRFVISRAILRILLGRYLNLPPQQIEFEIGLNKKPFVKGYPLLHYNVSHSGNYILIAFSAEEIGVDVELPDLNMDYQEIMNISYSPEEVNYVNSSSQPLHEFYSLWTRKEALLKATAKGIDDSLQLVPSIDGLHTTMISTIGSNKSWIVQTFNVDQQYWGSVASPIKHAAFFNFNH